MSIRPNYTSQLPYGTPYPVGDADLWEKIVATASGDLLQLYADVRGISRQAAKHETFIIRYVTTPNPTLLDSITGRFSSRGPEMQRIRHARKPEPLGGSLAAVDFSDVEKRVAAHYSKGPILWTCCKCGMINDVLRPTCSGCGGEK